MLEINSSDSVSIKQIPNTQGYDGHCLRAYSYWPEKFTHIPNTVEGVNSIKELHDDIRSDSKAPTFALTISALAA